MCELISVDKEYSDNVMDLMEQTMRDFIISHPSPVGRRHYVDMGSSFPPATGLAEWSSLILDPPLVTRKGAPQKNRLKGALEKNPKRKRVSSKKKATNTPTTTLEQQPSIAVPYLPPPPPNELVQGYSFPPPTFQWASHGQLPQLEFQATQDQLSHEEI